MDNNISFSKIVATPTLNSWSQAYNAGKLFAVLSLEKDQEQSQNLESLNILGKDFLEQLEQEFFTIEEKGLESIKTAISNTFQNIPASVNLSFSAGIFSGNVLYLFGLGNGKAFIKRGGKTGQVLESSTDEKNLVASSGFIKDNDIIVLSTEAFSHVFSNDEINASLDGLPTDIAESLAPKVHKSDNGKVSAIIIKYEKPHAQEESTETLQHSNIDNQATEIDQKENVKASLPIEKYLSFIKSKLKKPNIKIAPTRKTFLVLSIIITFVLVSSIFLAIREQNNAKIQALFTKTYADAQKKYDEGESLLDLNKNLAREAYLAAGKILNDNKDKFPAKSKEADKSRDLLKKVEEGLSKFSPVDKSGLDRSELSITVENGSGIEGSAGKAAEILKELGYDVVSTGNADNYDYEEVTIKIKGSRNDFLDLLEKDLSKDYVIKSTSSDLSSSSSTDALIIVGK